MTHWLGRRALALLFWFVAPSAGAQSDTIPGVATPIVSTHHRIVVAGKPLSYTARAGVLPIRNNDDGSARAYVFFVAYITDGGPNEKQRPITFLWNGGPGANSLLLHLSAFGPRRLDEGDGPTATSRPARLVDNQETLLTQTDLVFVDPVGTGFSRPTRPEYAADFYGVREDIAATREFIRTYRTHFDAWDAPIYLAGESYGTWRAAGTADAMAQNGEHVSGVILISGGIPVGPIASREMRAALFLPTRLATAAYHHRLAPELARDTARAMRDAENWGRTVYAPALTRINTLSSAERSAIRARLARYTGVDTTVIDQKTLIVDGGAFLNNLLHGQGLLERFDTRQTTHRESADDREREGRRRALINTYLREELGFKTDLVYQGLENGWSASDKPPSVNSEWKYDQGDPGTPMLPVDDGPPGGTPPWVQRTFASDRATRTFVAAGVYDALNSCPLIAYQISRLEPSLRERISTGCYAGGHMMYLDRDARVSLRRDLGRFFDGASR
jgi:carboxypeptidase C (cathepsin A)